MKKVIVAGAAGFVGYHLVNKLSAHGIHTYAVVRPQSEHNGRLAGLPGVDIIEMDLAGEAIEFCALPRNCDCFINLLWQPGGRYDFEAQMGNAMLTLRMAKLASSIDCKKFIGIGSQAEYGATKELLTENLCSRPICAYGMAKVAACYLTKELATVSGIEWGWARIFSIYGIYEPPQRLIPYILDSLKAGKDISLSSCRQNWDFLYGSDAGEALLAMAENGRNGEIYNIADGRYRPLKEYVEEMVGIYGSKAQVLYGADPKPFVSLQPSIAKLQRDTGWYPKVSFEQGIRTLLREQDKT